MIRSFVLLLIALSLFGCGGGGGGGDELPAPEEPKGLLDRGIGSTVPLRIMPLGDSITEAFSGWASYRYFLWRMLNDEAGLNVDFVGSKRGVRNGSPKYSNFDQDHQGHWDWTTDRVLRNLDPWVQAHTPDLVLLHLGSNDLFRDHGVESTLSEIEQIIGIFRKHNPNVGILLAQIIPSGRIPGTIQDFNSKIPVLAERLSQPNSPVIVVDQWTQFWVRSDTRDGVHPSESGETKIAQRFFNGITEYLSKY